MSSESGVVRVPPDQALRRGVFWAVLLLAVAAATVGHAVESHLSYDVGELLNTRYGSFGASLARCPARVEGYRYVVILGNSVYQGHRIVHLMDQFSKEEQRRIQFVNLALTGAGVPDYVVQAADAIQHSPDLVVVCLAECTFQNFGPIFRTDVDQQAFEPGIFRSIPWDFYQREFDLKSAGASMTSSVFPLARLDQILRFKLMRDKHFPKLLSNHLLYSQLNLVGDSWRRARARSQNEAGDRGPRMDDYRETMIDLLEVLKRGNTQALFIVQENDFTPLAEETMATVMEVIDKYEFAAAADFSSLWSPENFGDRVHPKREYRETYAREHYQAICAALDSQ